MRRKSLGGIRRFSRPSLRNGACSVQAANRVISVREWVEEILGVAHMTNHSPSADRHRNAFTIVELLVVISIISLLVALMLPALGSARAISQQIQCANNMRQIGLGVFGYANEFNNVLQWFYAEPPYSRNTAYYHWADANVPYSDDAVSLKIGGGAAGSAGEMRATGAFTSGIPVRQDRSRLFDCPTVSNNVADAWEYAWSSSGGGNSGPIWRMMNPDVTAANFSRNMPRLDRFPVPAKTARFIDTGWSYVRTVSGFPNNSSFGSFSPTSDSQMDRLGMYAPHQSGIQSTSENWARNGAAPTPDSDIALLPSGGRNASNIWMQDGHIATISARDLVLFTAVPAAQPFTYGYFWN